MVPPENTWSWRLRFIETYPCGLLSHRAPSQDGRAVAEPDRAARPSAARGLDGQFFALIVRLVGNGWCSSSVMSKSSGSFGNDAAMSLRVELRYKREGQSRNSTKSRVAPVADAPQSSCDIHRQGQFVD